jgi:putative oxidoreductase
MNSFFSSAPQFQDRGLALIRFCTGFFLMYHGWEIFDSRVMSNYMEWDFFKNASSGQALLYTGKIAELAGGSFYLLAYLHGLQPYCLSGQWV